MEWQGTFFSYKQENNI